MCLKSDTNTLGYTQLVFGATLIPALLDSKGAQATKMFVSLSLYLGMNLLQVLSIQVSQWGHSQLSSGIEPLPITWRSKTNLVLSAKSMP